MVAKIGLENIIIIIKFYPKCGPNIYLSIFFFTNRMILTKECLHYIQLGFAPILPRNIVSRASNDVGANCVMYVYHCATSLVFGVKYDNFPVDPVLYKLIREREVLIRELSLRQLIHVVNELRQVL